MAVYHSYDSIASMLLPGVTVVIEDPPSAATSSSGGGGNGGTTPPPATGGQLDFTDPANSGLITVI